MIVESLIKAIDRGREGKEQGYSIGLPKLEQVVDGVCKGVYTLIAAESGVGKSSFMLYSYLYNPIKEHLDDGKLKISLFSLEMNADKILAKLLSTHIFETYGVRLSLKQLLSVQRGYTLSDEYYRLVIDSIPWMKKVESILTVYDKSNNARTIYDSLIKELKARGHFEETSTRIIYTPNDPDLVHIVCIDHLGRVQPVGGNTLKQEMDATSKSLYTLKNICNISPIVIQQMNRNIQSVDRRKESMLYPQTSDLKDTNNTVEDAETILAIYSPNKAKLKTHLGYDISIMGDSFRSVYVLKSRYGEADVIDNIYYDGKCNVWKELPRSSEINDFSRFENPLWYLDTSESKDAPNNKFNFKL